MTRLCGKKKSGQQRCVPAFAVPHQRCPDWFSLSNGLIGGQLLTGLYGGSFRRTFLRPSLSSSDAGIFARGGSVPANLRASWEIRSRAFVCIAFFFPGLYSANSSFPTQTRSNRRLSPIRTELRQASSWTILHSAYPPSWFIHTHSPLLLFNAGNFAAPGDDPFPASLSFYDSCAGPLFRDPFV